MEGGDARRINQTENEDNNGHTNRSKVARRKSGRVVPSRYLSSSEKRGSSLNSTISDSRYEFKPPVYSTPMVPVVKSALSKPSTASVQDSAFSKLSIAGGQDSALSKPGATGGHDSVLSLSAGARTRQDSGSQARSGRSDQNKGKSRDDRLTAALPESVLAYNKYLTWTFMARRAAASSLSLNSALKRETEEMCQLATVQQKQLCDLQRRVQAAELYSKLLNLEKHLAETRETIERQSSPAVSQLARLSSLLTLYKNLFSTKGCTPVTQERTFIDNLNSAVSQCCSELRAVCAFIGERGEELQSSANALLSLSSLLEQGSDQVNRIVPSLDRLSSLSLTEASERSSRALHALPVE